MTAGPYKNPIAVRLTTHHGTTTLAAIFLTDHPYPMPRDTFAWDAREWTVHTVAHKTTRRGSAVLVLATPKGTTITSSLVPPR